MMVYDVQAFAEAFRGIVCHVSFALLATLISAAAIAWLWKNLTIPMRRVFGGGVVRIVLAVAMVGTGIVESFSKHTNGPPRRVASQVQSVTPEDITNGWRVAATREGRAPSRPQDGAYTIHEPWLLRGGFKDIARIPFGGWLFPWRDGFTDGLTVFADGEIRPELRAPYFPRPFDAPLAVVPAFNWHLLPGGVSNVFWYASTPSNSLVVAWENAPVGNDVNCLTNFQAEFFADGRFAYRYDDREVGYAPAFPFDWDNDGLENSVDPEPLVAGADAHGTNAEWYNTVCSNVFETESWRMGVNSNAYYFVDVVAARGPAPIYFTGDRVSGLGNPVVVAHAFETNRVPLLIGINYAVTSSVPIAVSVPTNSAPSGAGACYAAVTTNGVSDCAVQWPLEFAFSESIGEPSRVYTVSVGPYDPGGELTWNGAGGGMRSDGTRSGASSGCDCGCLRYGGNSIVFSCSAACTCNGECRAVGSYTLENALFAVTGGVCRCGFDDPGPAGSLPTNAPSFSVSFSRRAVIFEDAYEASPGVTMPKRSSRVRITVDAYGGEHGGWLSVASENLGKLVPVGDGVAFPIDRSLAAEEVFHVTGVYEGAAASVAEDDVKVGGTFAEYVTARRHSSSNNLTVVKVELTPNVTAPRNDALGRHEYGVCELVRKKQYPSAPMVTWNPVGGGSNAVNQSGHPCYRFPLLACECPLRIELKDASYLPLLSCIEPSSVEVREVDLCTYGLPAGKAGGIGLLQAFYVKPLTVSFSEIAVEEVPSTNGLATGYFRYAFTSNLWSHTSDAGAGKWIDVFPGNRMWNMQFRDEAAIALEMLPITPDGVLTNDYSFGWMDGEMEWDVPFGWNARGTTNGTEAVGQFGGTKQEFYIDRWGFAGVRKFHNQATRYVDDARYLNWRRIYDNEVRNP